MRNLQTSANGHAAVDSITDVPLPSTSSLPSISSLITLLADVQTKLIQHHQLQQSQLHRSRIRRTEYATNLQTLLQQVEEQAKKRNRVQLSSFLKQEMKRREMESAKFEQRIIKGLEVKWERVFEKLMDGLEGILDEAKCEEMEWNGLVRRIVMEEQTRSDDGELLEMLRDAGRAWKTEDQAEESWRNAWETTNLTLERLSQRVQQPSASSQAGSGSQSFHHRRGHATITAAESEDDDETDEIPNRRQSVIQPRRRELEGSISTSTSASTSTSISTSAASTSTSITTPMSDPPTPISISLSKPSFETLPSLPNQNVEEQQPSHHPYSPSLTKREYTYSPITNQIPGQELFDESLERISPDAGFAYAQSQSHIANENGVPGDGLHPSSAADSRAKGITSSSSNTGGARSPLNRVKKSTNRIKIQTELAIDNEEEQKPNGELDHPSSGSIRSPKSSSAARLSSSQTQTQTQIRRTASIKRTSSNTSMKTTGGGSLRITASTTSTSINTSTTASVLVSGSGSASVSGKRTPSSSSPSVKKRNKNAPPSDETKSPLSKTENNATTSAYLSAPSTPTQSLSSPLSPATALAWKDYETRWRSLKSVSGLTFSNIPWPLVLGANGNTTQTTILDVEAIDPQLVFEFILFNPHPEQQQQQDHYHQPFSTSGSGSATSALTSSNWAKKRIRSALLRWHPDRFNATILKNVVKSDRKAVQDGVGKVVRILNEMLVKEGGGVVGDISA
ncbi:hypothetical protein Clacol_005934 [Clathrus columnatus]|uniref:Uncharacterized protein n=1 Tax=Clathrus columnatus TaxID=1419009 RepID=A0AAV5AGA0_9AGAM|nr:hypothetical protein Clacol_005934 [Clathrus columnatus]